MNPSDWRRAATLVTQHKQEATMAKTHQLSSIPRSQIAIDDSHLPIVHYGTHMPIAASTPTGTDVHAHSSQQEDSYQQIIQGIPHSSLYPTLSSLSSGAVASDTDVQSLCDKVTIGLDKYLQDTEQLRALEVNYFGDTARPTNTLLMSETTEQVNESSQNNLPTAKHESIEEVESAINTHESLKIDTSHTLQCQPVLKSTSQHHTNRDENHQQHQLQDQAEQDAHVHHDDEHAADDSVTEATSTQTEQSLAAFLPTNDVTIPTEKVGCIWVTSHLQQFLEEYPPPSDKQALLDVYHMLSLLDKYLYDNPKQHTHCMSSDNEYVALLKCAIHLNVDLSTFPTLLAVLSILLYTQDGNLEYIQFLQEEYNRYYADKSRKYMVNLEMKSTEIQNHMHDSVTCDFDRVSDFNDNGLTPLQGQQDEQPESVNRAENAIDNDVVDIMTLYPLWSTDTNERSDNNQVASDSNRKEIQDELYKDTPVKTENNKPYIDNIDAYNRDRALITKSLSDRLGIGQNSLPGAQQVRVAVKHTDQMT